MDKPVIGIPELQSHSVSDAKDAVEDLSLQKVINRKIRPTFFIFYCV